VLGLAESPGQRRRPHPLRAALRTALLVAAAAFGLYIADRLVLAPRREQQQRIEELERQKRALESVVQRLKHTDRRAQVVVLERTEDPQGGPPTVKLRFVEVDPQGTPMGKEREFILRGEEVYFEALVIKFEDRYVEQGEALRGKALLLFRRVFTNELKPDDGYPLDERGMAPEVYAAQEAPAAFERDLWARFWEYANDPAAARAKGVRALHGEALVVRPRKNMVYILELRQTGELTIRPAAGPPEKN
jgi:hypothetical protein